MKIKFGKKIVADKVKLLTDPAEQKSRMLDNRIKNSTGKYPQDETARPDECIDADFIEEFPFKKALIENFNQATIYLTNENAKYFAIALK